MSDAGNEGDATPREPTYERVPADEFARLRRIEDAVREVLNEMQGRRSATPMLAAMGTLRAALKEKPEPTDSPSD